MVTVRIEEEDLLEMLMDRVRFWTDDPDCLDLFEMYYDNMIQGGAFDYCDFNVMAIVDNDYVNWLDVISEEDFENYHIEDENDERIVAHNNGLFLVYCG